jgi:hypothetical protein
MLQRALPLTVLQYRRDRLLVQQVRQALTAHPEQTHSADGVAWARPATKLVGNCACLVLYCVAVSL